MTNHHIWYRTSHFSLASRLCKQKMDAPIPTSFSRLSVTLDDEDYNSVKSSNESKGKAKEKARGKKNEKPTQNTKLRGRDHDSPGVRISKTITWLLRHAADSEGLEMRGDGYVKVSDVVILISVCSNSSLTLYIA